MTSGSCHRKAAPGTVVPIPSSSKTHPAVTRPFCLRMATLQSRSAWIIPEPGSCTAISCGMLAKACQWSLLRVRRLYQFARGSWKSFGKPVTRGASGPRMQRTSMSDQESETQESYHRSYSSFQLFSCGQTSAVALESLLILGIGEESNTSSCQWRAFAGADSHHHEYAHVQGPF